MKFNLIIFASGVTLFLFVCLLLSTDFASQLIAWISRVAWAVITVLFWTRKPNAPRASVATPVMVPFVRRIMNVVRLMWHVRANTVHRCRLVCPRSQANAHIWFHQVLMNPMPIYANMSVARTHTAMVRRNAAPTVAVHNVSASAVHPSELKSLSHICLLLSLIDDDDRRY